MHPVSRWRAARAALVCALLASPALGQVASTLIREGETVLPGVTVAGIATPGVNGIGGWIFLTTQSDSLDRFWGNATGGSRALLRTEGVVSGFTQTAFEFSFGFANSGAICYGPTISTPTRDCVWLDNTPILNEQDPIPTLPGQFSRFNSDPQITYNGTPYWMGGFATTPTGATSNRAFFKGTGATVLIKGGDNIPSAGLPLDSTFSPFGNRLSGTGVNYIMGHRLQSGSTTNDDFVMVNGDLYMAGGSGVREGSPVPLSVGGSVGENWGIFDAIGINDAGDVFFTGDTSLPTTADAYVFVKNSFAMREGAAVSTPIGPGTITGNTVWADANETMDWAVHWQATVGTSLECLVVNGQVVLIETQLVDWNGDGVIDAADNNGRLADITGARALSISERYMVGSNPFVDVYFTADIDFLGTPSATDDLEGGFRISVLVPEPASLSLLVGAGLLVMRRRYR